MSDAETYAWYKAHGICTQCHHEKAYGGKIICAVNAKEQARLQKWKKRQERKLSGIREKKKNPIRGNVNVI